MSLQTKIDVSANNYLLSDNNKEIRLCRKNNDLLHEKDGI